MSSQQKPERKRRERRSSCLDPLLDETATQKRRDSDIGKFRPIKLDASSKDKGLLILCQRISSPLPLDEEPNLMGRNLPIFEESEVSG